jgi:hypothetical protein
MLLCIIVDYATRFMNAFFVTSFIKHELSECLIKFYTFSAKRQIIKFICVEIINLVCAQKI